MLTLTEAAGAHLTEILDDRDCPDGVAIRFLCQESAVSLVLDNEKPGDSTFEHQGRTVLRLDPDSAKLLDNETVDFKQNDTGGQLYLSRKYTGSE
ncbi:MAG: hypothetical protein JSU72_16680 [Deltaproteobacteria bacterium]|nr:MAG: hypothetical protein JSU72_16680 [Deltaproteobacteria bacterium]